MPVVLSVRARRCAYCLSQWGAHRSTHCGALAPSAGASPCLITCLLWLSVLDEPTDRGCGAARLVAAHSTGVRPWARTRKRDGTGCEVFRMHIKWAQPEAERARSLARPFPLPAPAQELHAFLVAVVKAETVAEPRSRVFVCRAADVQLGPADRSLSAIAVDSSARSWKGPEGRSRAGGFHSTATSVATEHTPAGRHSSAR